MFSRYFKILFVPFFVLTACTSFSSQLLYSSFLGGNDNGEGYTITLDTAGNIYIAGFTDSTTFPATSGAFDSTYNGNRDVFVSKYTPSGNSRIFSTYLGGENMEIPYSIALDSANNIFIGGYTNSSSFPVTAGAIQTTNHGGYSDAFLTKLNSTGSALLYSTYLGDSQDEQINKIIVDSNGNAYICGYSSSSDFHVTSGAFDTTYHPLNNGFVAKVNPNGTALLFSTFLAGSGNDIVRDMDMDTSNNLIVFGVTGSPDFPVTAGAFDTTFHGVYDDFISKLNSTGSTLMFSTFLGGEAQEDADAVKLDSSGNIYVTGYTQSTTFPISPYAFQSTRQSGSSPRDAFIAKLDSTASNLLYSTYLGGNDYDVGVSLAVDSIGQAYVTGYTGSSTGFPITSNAFDSTFGGLEYHDAGFISKLNYNGSALLYSSFLSGSLDDGIDDFTLDKSGKIYLTGYTYSTDFFLTPDALDKSINTTMYKPYLTILQLPDTGLPPSAPKVPYLKLFIGQGLSPAFDLADYNTGGVATSYRISYQAGTLTSITGSVVYQKSTTYARADGNNYVLENVLGTNTTLNGIKYSTYKLPKLPQVVLRPGGSTNMIIKATISAVSTPVIPETFGVSSSITVSDLSKVTSYWSDESTLTITALAGFNSPVNVDVMAAPNFISAPDEDIERIEVYPAIATTAFEFGNGTDTTAFGYQTPSGVSTLATIGYTTGINDPTGNPSNGGALKITFGSTSSGIKITPKFNSWLPNTPGTWYTLRIRVFGTNTINNYLQVLYNGNPGVSPTDVQGYFKYSMPTTWAYYDIPINSYSPVSSAPVMYPQLVIKANGATGTVYVDELEIFQATPQLLTPRYKTSDNYAGGKWNDGSATTKWGLQVLSGSPTESVSNGQLVLTTSGASNVQTGVKYTASTASGKVYTVSAIPGRQVGMHMQTNFVSGTPSLTLTQAQVNLLGAAGPASATQGGDIGAAAEIGRISPRTLHLAFNATNSNYQVQFVIKSAGNSTINIDNTLADIDNDDPNYGEAGLFD